MTRCSGLGIALLVAGCGPRSAPQTPPPSSANVAPKVVQESLDGKLLLGDLPLRASRFGAGPVSIVASAPMSEGERVGAFVEIPKDACLLAYARSSPSLEDIDLAAFAAEGNPVAVDEGPDPKPTILICPPHPDRVYVAAHAAAGEGLCVIAAQLVPRERAELVGRAAGAHGAAPRSPETWPGLDENVRTHRLAVGGTWEEQRRVAVAVDARAPSAVSLSIEEGGCTDALVVPDDDVSLVDVDLFDLEGRLIARAKDTSAVRSVTVCSPLPVSGSLQVRPHVGRGLVAIVIGKSKGDSAREIAGHAEIAWVAATQPLDVTRAAREKSLGKEGYGAPTSTQSGQLQLGRRATLPVDLAGGPCARIDVVAGAPLALVEASVWDDGGALLGSGEGSDGVVIHACGTGKVRVDLGTRGRPGPYALLVRPEKWKYPVFAAHPLAASRMLARAPEGKTGAVRFALLESARRTTHDATVPAGQCLNVAVGASGEGTGLELRLFDAITGEELDRSHGQFSASVRACASAAARPMRLETRATSGKLEAVIGEKTN